MSDARGQRVLAWVIGGIGVAAVASVIVLPVVWAQDVAPATASRPYDPFALAPSEGAIPWERHSDQAAEPLPPDTKSLPLDLLQRVSREPKANVYAAQTWAETTHPYAVHEAFSAYTSQMSRDAATNAAAWASGLSGIENLGVEP